MARILIVDDAAFMRMMLKVYPYKGWIRDCRRGC